MILSPETLTMLHNAANANKLSAETLEALAIACFTDGVRWAVQDMHRILDAIRAATDEGRAEEEKVH